MNLESLQVDHVTALLKTLALQYGWNLIAAILILVVGRWASRLVRHLVERGMQRAKLDKTLVSFASSVTYVALMAFVIVAAIGQLGVQTTSFVAILGAAGLAVGLSLQGSLSNFASGVLMILFRPMKVGDAIEAAGHTGEVLSLGIFSTELLTGDQRRVIVPNAKITADSITNMSANPTRRLDVVVNVAYSQDLQRVKDVLMNVVRRQPLLLPDPAPVVAVLELAEGCVKVCVRPFAKNEHYFDALVQLNEAIKAEFDAQGIGFPIPRRDVMVLSGKLS